MGEKAIEIAVESAVSLSKCLRPGAQEPGVASLDLPQSVRNPSLGPSAAASWIY